MLNGTQQQDEKVRTHLLERGRWIAERDIDQLVAHSAIPFIAYVQGEILVVNSRDDLAELYRSHCDSLEQDGAYDAQFALLSVEDMGKGRLTTVSEWRLEYKNRTQVFSTRHMFRIEPGSGPIILEILEDLTPHETSLSFMAKSHYQQISTAT